MAKRPFVEPEMRVMKVNFNENIACSKDQTVIVHKGAGFKYCPAKGNKIVETGDVYSGRANDYTNGSLNNGSIPSGCIV